MADFVLRNDETGETYSLGPMYRGTRAYVEQKVESEKLSYPWTLIEVEPDDADE